jgi:predicted MFS family arabinose efflux permease
MKNVSPSIENSQNKKLILLSLILSNFAIVTPNILTGLLLVEISTSFNVSIGIAGQIRTVYHIIAVFSALLLGVFSVRYKHKSLLLIGLFFVLTSAVSCGFSNSYNSMLIFYSLSGLGNSLVFPLSFSMISEHFTLEERGSAIGYLIAGSTSSIIISSPVISFLSNLRGWRSAFLVYVIPITILSMILILRSLPSTSSQNLTSKGMLLEGFKEIFSNRSAISCLFAFILSVSAFQVIVAYGVAFFKQKLSLTTDFTTFFFVASALCFTLGSLSGGRLINKVGRKPLTIIAAFFAGVVTILFTNVSILSFSLFTGLVISLLNGVRFAGSSSLTLEQVPKFRATMMALYSAADNLGSALGVIIGGYTLLLYDYSILGTVLGILGILAASFFFFLTKDPTTENA